MAVPTNSLNNVVRFDATDVKRFPLGAGIKAIAGYLFEVSGGAGIATYALDTGPVLGFSTQNVDNTLGADGDKFIDIATKGEIIVEGNAALTVATGALMNAQVFPNAAPTTDGIEVDEAGSNVAGRLVAFENTNDQQSFSFPIRIRVGAENQ